MSKAHKTVSKTAKFLAKTTKAKGVSVAQDKNGFYCYTHRARSKSYKTMDAIPKKDIEFIESTG